MRETLTHVQVSPDLIDEEVKDGAGSVLNSIRLGFRSQLANNAVKLILGKEFGNLAGRKDIIDVD